MIHRVSWPAVGWPPRDWVERQAARRCCVEFRVYSGVKMRQGEGES